MKRPDQAAAGPVRPGDDEDPEFIVAAYLALVTAAVLRDLPVRPMGCGGLICADRADCGVLITS